MIYSDKEVRKQLESLYVNCDALGLSDWEFAFINDMSEIQFPSITSRQKKMISKIYMKFFE